jgi:hypothetical protein
VQHGSSTCPPSYASAWPPSWHSWSRADGGSCGLASSPSTLGSTSSDCRAHCLPCLGRWTPATCSITSTSSLPSPSWTFWR